MASTQFAALGLDDVIAQALVILDGGVADPETEAGTGSDALPSDEQEFGGERS